MQPRQLLLPLLLIGLAVPVHAAATVQLELVGDMQGSAMLFQEWSQLLGKAGIRNVRIRAVEESDQVGVQTQGDAQSPLYVVTGIVRSRDELVTPCGRIGRGDVARLAKWLNELAENGPTMGKQGKSHFGLSNAQYQKAREDLASPVGFATQGMTPQQIVEKIAEKLKLPLKLDRPIAQAMGDDKLDEELNDLSCGTALAYALRSAGYGLLPRVEAGQPTYEVVKIRGDLEVWPVGWPSEKTAKEGLPGLFEFRNVNVQKSPAATVIAAIAKGLKTPALIDRNALARHGIDPAKKLVSMPRGRTTYGIALRRLLFQASMQYEVRYDESDTPFLWITSLKP